MKSKIILKIKYFVSIPTIFTRIVSYFQRGLRVIEGGSTVFWRSALQNLKNTVMLEDGFKNNHYEKSDNNIDAGNGFVQNQ
ncbi:MAG: hypothetical protein IPP61_08570 [Cytophagaceae bacterium]|nr:hypothetical protein [Cytophagaceae bacterium]MBL0325217.1 hypothetical protein [Cytophagaceae bacterium]